MEERSAVNFSKHVCVVLPELTNESGQGKTHPVAGRAVVFESFDM